MIENNTQITTEILSYNDLIFQPKTIDEAVFIQEKIFELGGAWFDQGKKKQNIKLLAQCVSGGMYTINGWLNTRPGDEVKKVGILCTSEQFDEAYVPPLSAKEQGELARAFNGVKAKLTEVTAELSEVKEILVTAGLPLKKSAAHSPKGA
jgi:hypothetical protein